MSDRLSHIERARRRKAIAAVVDAGVEPQHAAERFGVSIGAVRIAMAEHGVLSPDAKRRRENGVGESGPGTRAILGGRDDWFENTLRPSLVEESGCNRRRENLGNGAVWRTARPRSSGMRY